MPKVKQIALETMPGFEDCPFLVRSNRETEVIRDARRHAREAHDNWLTDEELREFVREVEWTPLVA